MKHIKETTKKRTVKQPIIQLRFCLTLLIILMHAQVKSQGIEFLHNLDSALVKAKAEKRMVFVDFYTSWCGPCKILTSDVFPLPEVGRFYNANFINCKVQCDDGGTGAQIGKKYNISAYPTLMFMDEAGNIIHSTAGAPDAKGLIELGKTAQNPERNQLAMVREWDRGNRDHDFMVKYFTELMSSYRRDKAAGDFTEWFNTLDKKQKSAKGTFELIAIVKSGPFSVPFEYLEASTKKLYKSVGRKTVDSFIATSYLWYFKGVQLSGLMNKELSQFKSEMAKFKAKGYPYYDEYAEFYRVFDSKNSEGRDDINEYMRRGTAFLSKYGKKNDAYTISLVSMLGNWTGGKDKGYAGIQWMEELLRRNPNPKYLSTYVYILWRNYHYDKAIDVCREIRANLVRDGKSTEDIEKQISEIEGYKLKYGA